jgi:dipeptidyl aminopeptidase/acylaminoacyl peptidase
MFDLAKYRSPAGDLVAYVSRPPEDDQKHPAIIWVVGGFSNSIGAVAWAPADPANDQSASAFREAGVLMMYPSLRGGNRNPGVIEYFYGEVDDLLAARDYLADLPFVDPARIYLGGHSTGGTLVLLVAESSSKFRAVFSFGPAGDVRGYGADSMHYDFSNPRESDLRSPIKWLDAIQSPTFIYEGSEGTISALKALAAATKNPAVHCFPVAKATHFSTLRPLSQLIAQKILQDTGPAPNLAFTEQEIAGAMAGK